MKSIPQIYHAYVDSLRITLTYVTTDDGYKTKAQLVFASVGGVDEHRRAVYIPMHEGCAFSIPIRSYEGTNLDDCFRDIGPSNTP